MFLGIDLGTSEIKTVLIDHDGMVVGSASRSLRVMRPQPRWSEQDPQMWWQAMKEAVGDLQQSQRAALAAVRAIGLSGQMHGATLLDERGDVLRHCILWNDTRSAAECESLTREWPDLAATTGNLAMPGFTAPKLMWVRKHEPDTFKRVATVLLPKAYVRLRMCGERIGDADASGHAVARRRQAQWSGRRARHLGVRRGRCAAGEAARRRRAGQVGAAGE